MKKQYTRKQIVEAIKYWKNLLESMSATEANAKATEILKSSEYIHLHTLPEDVKANITEICIPNGFDRIGIATFYNCSNLKNVIIPNSVKYIDQDAFCNCKKLSQVTIEDDGLKEIQHRAFSRCHSLSSIVIPDSVEKIGENAFSQCYKLKGILVGSGVTTIKDDAFNGCIQLEQIVFRGKTLAEVKVMKGYPWGADKEIIICGESLDPNINRKTKYTKEQIDAAISYWINQLKSGIYKKNGGKYTKKQILATIKYWAKEAGHSDYYDEI